MKTLACPFIKREMIIHKMWCESFKRLILPREEFKLLMVDMAKDETITNLMKSVIGTGWAEVEYLKDPPKKYPCITESPNSIDPQFMLKRHSCSETFQICNSHRVGDVLFFEDDIIAPPDAYTNLSKYFNTPDVLAFTGTQYSRTLSFSPQMWLLVWDWVDDKHKCRKIELEKKTGYEFIGAAATGFTYYKKEFCDIHDFTQKGLCGQDVMSGYRIHKMGKKILLVWDLKLPHLGLEDGRFRVYRSKMCKTLVIDEHGTRF